MGGDERSKGRREDRIGERVGERGEERGKEHGKIPFLIGKFHGIPWKLRKLFG
jgi:hypothetical protein